MRTGTRFYNVSTSFLPFSVMGRPDRTRLSCGSRHPSSTPTLPSTLRRERGPGRVARVSSTHARLPRDLFCASQGTGRSLDARGRRMGGASGRLNGTGTGGAPARGRARPRQHTAQPLALQLDLILFMAINS